ncbi:MAG: septation regulator SpoVG [Eubacteriales bacterium]|nr:septation regulator SpoVG [Eubacteriales bacterium]
MKVTDIRIRRINRDGKVRAIASITIDECFVVHDIKVIDGTQGLFVAMPSRQSADGEFRDIAHPINTETRTMIRDMIVERYMQMVEEEEGTAPIEYETEEQE